MKMIASHYALHHVSSRADYNATIMYLQCAYNVSEHLKQSVALSSSAPSLK